MNFLLSSSLFSYFFSPSHLPSHILNLGIGFNKYSCIFFSLKWKYSVLGMGGRWLLCIVCTIHPV